MHRKKFLAAGFVAILSTFCGTAQAQWGYGYYPYGYGGYGWGGWGGTLQGEHCPRPGLLQHGAGIYNHQTAIARSINTDTAIRWNQYVYLSQKQATHDYMVRRDAALAKDRSAYEAIVERIQEHPNRGRRRGRKCKSFGTRPALGSTVHSSASRMAETPISAKSIRETPSATRRKGSLSAFPSSRRPPSGPPSCSSLSSPANGQN